MAGYDDGRVACTGGALVIRHYYFPAGAKRIPYSAIREARRAALVLHLDGHMKPVITPDDPGQVADLLTTAG